MELREVREKCARRQHRDIEYLFRHTIRIRRVALMNHDYDGDMTIEELEASLDAKTPESETLWRRFARDAQICSTPLFSLSKASGGDVLRLAGSGTLLAHDESHYILTAAHVWHEVLKHADFVGVTLREVYDHTCLLEVSTILTYGPERPKA